MAEVRSLPESAKVLGVGVADGWRFSRVARHAVWDTGPFDELDPRALLDDGWTHVLVDDTMASSMGSIGLESSRPIVDRSPISTHRSRCSPTSGLFRNVALETSGVTEKFRLQVRDRLTNQVL